MTAMVRYALPIALILLAGCRPAGDREAFHRVDRATVAIPARLDRLTGKVVAVADGDTLTLLVDQKEIRIRVSGIDCPERGQPFGTRAKKFTGDHAFGQLVTVNVLDHDRYGRTIGRVALPDGTDLSKLLVGYEDKGNDLSAPEFDGHFPPGVNTTQPKGCHPPTVWEG